MTLEHGRYRYACISLALITVVLAGSHLRAQTQPLLPSVDLRRDLTLSSEVWPGDFNGDGITDLVSSTGPTPPGESSAVLQIVLGHGDGTFGPPIVSDFAGRAIQVGDFNGDRRADVVAATTSPAETVVVLASNGDGTLAAPQPIEAAFGAFALAADFNGDARRDLVIVGGPEIRVHPGNGDLTFGLPYRIPVDVDGIYPDAGCLETVPGTMPCGGGISGDFDNDGDRDFAIVTGGQTVGVYLNSGSLLFSADTIAFPMVMATDVTAADLDGDGALDLIVSSGSPATFGDGDGRVSTLTGNGDGTFGLPVQYENGHGRVSDCRGRLHTRRTDKISPRRTVRTSCGPIAVRSCSRSTACPFCPDTRASSDRPPPSLSEINHGPPPRPTTGSATAPSR
jgi:hypothetical protein